MITNEAIKMAINIFGYKLVKDKPCCKVLERKEGPETVKIEVFPESINAYVEVKTDYTVDDPEGLTTRFTDVKKWVLEANIHVTSLEYVLTKIETLNL